MKNRILAIIAIAMLLIGSIGLATNITPVSAEYVNFTIGYAPGSMPIPIISPPVGTYNYTVGSEINMTAPAIVNGTAGVRYVFDYWNKTDVNGTELWSGGNPVHITPALTADEWTYTATYKVQYYLDVISPHGTPWGAGWCDEYSMRWAGLDVGVVTLGYAHKAYFVNWTGDGSGTNFVSIDSAINMTGPKTVVANWVEKYYLWTDSSYYPWGSGYDPGQQGYKPYCTYVNLTAPTYTSINPNNWQWRFDRWEIEKWNGTAWVVSYIETVENITVHIDAPTTATVYFHLQWYLTVTDSPSAVDSGVETQSGYNDHCTNITLNAPAIVPDLSDPGIRWVFKQWYIAGFIDWFSTSLTIHIGHPHVADETAVAIYTKECHLDVGDNVGGLSGVSAQSGWFAVSTVVPLSAPCDIPIASDERYVFEEWVKDPGHFTDSNCNTTITMATPRNATAYYKKQYLGTWEADPTLTGIVNLNTWNGWPVGGGSGWFDANVKYWWSCGSGPVPGSPFDYYFDHWTLNSVPQTQFMNSLQINFTGPVTGVANYLGKSAFYITPQTVIKDAPAVCTTFDVNVTAANLVDLYGVDFNVTWDPSLIELVGVDVEVDEIWSAYFIGLNDWNNTEGWYHLVATSLDGAPDDPYGFNGTHKIVKLTFHIIYDPCYIAIDHYVDCNIDLNVIKLADSNGHAMMPYNIHGGYYRINAIQPTLELRPSTVTISQKDIVFTVELWIKDAVKLHDFSAYIFFDSAHLQIVSIEIDTTFLTGPYEMFYYWKSNTFNCTHGIADIWLVQQQPGETLAYGEGRLAILTFRVNQSIIWTTAQPILHSWITLDTEYDSTWISVKCPAYAEIFPPLLKLANCEYKYLPIPGDVNKDGIVNVLDLQLVAGDYGSSTTYELNETPPVDLLDLVIVAINYGRDTP